MLSRNEKFVVFQGGEPSLLCYVDAILKNHEVRCRVINGAWSFIMDQRTGHAAWHSPSGKDSSVFQWVTLKNIPGAPNGGYNEVLEYVRSTGYTVGRRPPLKLLALILWSKITSFTFRFKEACGAFCGVMAGTVTMRAQVEEPFDDDIPF